MEIIGGGCSCPNRPHCGHGNADAFSMRAKARKRKEEAPKDKKRNRRAVLMGLTAQPKK